MTTATAVSEQQVHATVLADVCQEILSRIELSEEFRVFFGGDARLVRAMLNGVAGTPGGSVTVALLDGRAVGFLGLLPPLPGDRFHGIPSAIELAAVEVIPGVRRRGIAEAMFAASLGRTLEDHIVYAVGDPGFRDAGESVRAFRHRLVDVFRALGFFPLPTDYREAHLRRHSVFLVRMGADVPEREAERFLARLHHPSGAQTVAIALRSNVLRNLVRTDLERHGFDVVSVAADEVTQTEADVLVTEFPRGSGRLTVRVVDGERRSTPSTVWLPVTELVHLPDVIRARSTWWPRSSSNGS